MRFLRVVAPVGMLAATCVSQAWNETGHMVIAAIAEQHLAPIAKTEALRLLRVNATDKALNFVTSGPWADDIRSQRRETSSWHYINFFFRTDGRRAKGKPEPENVVWAIEQNRKILADRSRSDNERADALRFLIHFVGDAHQPLHTGARETVDSPDGDKGGNDVKILPPNLPFFDRPATNLHSLWDGGAGLFPYVGRPLDDDRGKTIYALATALMAARPERSMRGTHDLNPMHWAQEGFSLAKNVAYKFAPNLPLDDAYLIKARETSAEQATLAGYRLANLLNATLQ